MNIFLAILILFVSCNAAPQQPFNYNSYISSQHTTSVPFIHPPAQVHYVNIGQELQGDYKFGYDTGKGPTGQSFREETRLSDGTVKGQYGYLDAQNKMRIVKYTAGLNGFSIDSDTALNDQQLAASRPSQPIQTETHSLYSEKLADRGLVLAASNQPASIAQYQNQYSLYQPLSNSASVQQPYTGYSYNPQSQYNSQHLQYNPSAYQQVNGQLQLTATQLQQQALATARARQTALARQQQQEAIIRQQQQAATLAILAQQKAAQTTVQPQQSRSNQYANLASQYNSPQYQPIITSTPPSDYQATATPFYTPRHTVTEQKPDLLSNFIQLPGVKLIQLDRKPTPKPNSLSLPSSNFGLNSNEGVKNQEDEYQGPVVINAALLSYNIGANQQSQNPAANKKA